MVVGVDVENSIGCSTCCSDHGVFVCVSCWILSARLASSKMHLICDLLSKRLQTSCTAQQKVNWHNACSPHRTIVMLLCHHASHRNSHNHKQNDDGDEGGDDGHDGDVRPPPPPTTTITTKTPLPQPPPTTYSASSASASGCFFLMYIYIIYNIFQIFSFLALVLDLPLLLRLASCLIIFSIIHQLAAGARSPFCKCKYPRCSSSEPQCHANRPLNPLKVSMFQEKQSQVCTEDRRCEQLLQEP